MKNNNLSVLPWYDSLDKQDFKKSYAFGAVYPLYMLKGYITPFQIVNIDVDDFDDGYTIELVNFQTGVAVNVTTAMSPYISVAYVTGIFGNVIFMTDQPVITSPKIGRYFLRITTTLHQYFSDVITFVDSVTPFLKLEWWDVNDLQLEYGTLFYGNYGFQNLLYLQTELGKPEYTFTDEGEERNGYFFPTKQISEKVFKFNFLSSEYLLDVMRLIRMSDYIRITDTYGRCYNANQFEIKSEWETQGNLASATVQFQTDAVVKKIALPVLVVQRDVINATLFHNLVLTSATEIWFAFYDQRPDLSGYSFAGYCDNNNRIEVYKNGTKYILVNPQNNDMYAPINCSQFLYNYISLIVCNIENFNTQNVTNMQYMFGYCHNLTSLNISSFNTQNVSSMQAMFQSCNSLTSLDVSSFNTQNVSSMQAMFQSCRSLTSLDVSNFNTQNVTSMREMFDNCNSLTSLDVSNFNTQNVSSMYIMFRGCSSLTSLDVSNFNTQNVSSMYIMFSNCSSLTSLDVSNFNTQNVSSMREMFSNCSSLTSLDVSNFNTQNVSSMREMFSNCSSLTSLDVSNFNTQNVSSMYIMFRGCSSLTSLDVSNFNTQNVSSMYIMFSNCSSLTSLDVSNFNTQNVSSMREMFSNCSSLTSLDVSNFNTQNVTSMREMFYNCNSLTSLDLSNFNTQNVTSMQQMLQNCSSLTSIIANTFNIVSLTISTYMFLGCTSLVGGNGTPYSTVHINAEYARVDGENGLPGYFTAPQP